jgi:GNAT superfamily N-acetyltransferase
MDIFKWGDDCMEIDMTKLHIRSAYIDEWDTAMALAWKTFLKFEAEEYTPEGVRNFEDFVTDQTLKRMFIVGQYRLFCAFYGSHMVGMISIRECTHISLLFVEDKYHYNGIGRKLIEKVKDYLQMELGEQGMTVNASPYAVGFYHKMGFQDLRPQETRDGITYTPMVNRF